jgi:hypothetical protein
MPDLKRANKNRSKKRKPIIIIISILVLLSILFWGQTSIFSRLIGKLKKCEDLVCYAVASRAFESEIYALSYAESVFAAGGAGYVLGHDERFYVILATYFEQNEAEVVKEKNGATNMLKLVATGFSDKFDNAKDKKVIREVINKIWESVRMVAEIAIKLDLKEISDIEIISKLEEIKNEILDLQSKSASATKNELCVDVVVELIEKYLKALNSIMTSGMTKRAASARRASAQSLALMSTVISD